jgi:pimeloyl-ACP methyl ester carboxylesterase
MRVRTVSIGAAALVAVSALAGGSLHAIAAPQGHTRAAAPAADPVAALPVARIAWRPCEEDPAAQCGALRLPIDWSAPAGATFELAVARRLATDPKRRVGALLVNPGGPGASGVSLAIESNRFFGGEVSARFDVVGFDPRGVVGSNPVTCSRGAPRHQPRNEAEFAALVKANQQLRAECRKANGPLYDHVDTLSVVHDLEALRRALGERQLSFYGASYGTLIGQQYADLYDGRVRTMVLDGNLDHGHTMEQLVVGAAAAAEDSLREFAAWCARETACAMHGRPVLARWNEFLVAADEGRLTEGTDQERLPITRWYAVQYVYGRLLQPNFQGLGAWLATLRIVDEVTPIEPDGSEDGGQSVRGPVLCQDWTPRVRTYAEFARIVAAQRKAAPHLRYAEEGMEILLTCLGWPERANNPSTPVRLGRGAPILLLNSAHDAITGLPLAESLRRRAPGRFALLRYEGVGHTAYFRTPCVRAATDAYLVTGRAPADGTHCPAVPPTT